MTLAAFVRPLAGSRATVTGTAGRATVGGSAPGCSGRCEPGASARAHARPGEIRPCTGCGAPCRADYCLPCSRALRELAG
jgi:hypothetical protein